MGRTLVVLALAAGCGGPPDGAGPDAPLAGDPAATGTCTGWLTLDGATGTGAPTTLGPLALDAAGTDLCLHLDARANTRVHFAAWTEQRPGSVTGWASRLFDDTGAVVRDGWDVPLGDPPRAFLNLEWSPPVGRITDVVLHLWAPTQPGTTALYLVLFDPLE